MFVFAAGVPLFLGTERTDIYFAWTVRPPLTAAALGASYWASVVLGFLCSRQPCWHRARLAVPGPLLFTALTLLATLLHLDRFHFDSAHFIARLTTWAWLFIYAAVPLALGVSLIPQLQAPGQDPPRRAPLGMGLRTFLIVLAIPLGILGVGLFVTPTSLLEYWPWMLTPLTARAVGAWLCAIALISAHAALENDFVRIGPALGTMTAVGVLQSVALIRYPADFAWATVDGWLYLLMVIAIFSAGVYGLVRRRNASEARTGTEAAEGF